MHKKIAADLTSLAHRILQLKNKDEVLVLKALAHEAYEKLSVLAYVDEYINTTPQATETKEGLLAKIEAATPVVAEEPVIETPVVEDVVEEVAITPVIEAAPIEEVVTEAPEPVEEEKLEEIIEAVAAAAVEKEEKEQFTETLSPIEDTTLDMFAAVDEPLVAPTLEEELQDTISLDVAADLFEVAAPVKSLNDQLQKSIQIGLNDRIAFVKNLFDGDQGDFNRVVSQLNSFKTEKEAKKFINKMVKPDYDWTDKETYSDRLFDLIARKFA